MLFILLCFVDTPQIYYGFDLKPGGSLTVSESAIKQVEAGFRVSKVKGKPVRSLRRLESLIKPEDRYVDFEFTDRGGKTHKARICQKVRNWETANWLRLPMAAGKSGIINDATFEVVKVVDEKTAVVKAEISLDRKWKGTIQLSGISTKGMAKGSKIEFYHGAKVTVSKLVEGRFHLRFVDPGQTGTPKVFKAVSEQLRKAHHTDRCP